MFKKLFNTNSQNYQFARNISLLKYSKRFNFDQYKERPKRHFVLIYRYIDDMHYKRIPHRDSHLNHVEKFEKEGSIIIGGSFYPNDGACLFFQAQDETLLDNFVKKDPYFINGLVTNYEIKELDMFTKKKYDELAIYYKYR